MPLINGLKMACEPCIRGHRSTKCTHANERLMVPVRKPGRPLSSCPHPRDRPCGCGSVTAAIPKKQTCDCGSKMPAYSAAHQGMPQFANPTITEVPTSPTKTVFRVDKNFNRQLSNKKQPSVAQFERMDASQMNIREAVPHGLGISLPHEYGAPPPPTLGLHHSQYTTVDSGYGPVMMQLPIQIHPPLVSHANGADGYGNDVVLNGVDHGTAQSPLPTSDLPLDGNMNFGNEYWLSSPAMFKLNGDVEISSNAAAAPAEEAEGSCCRPTSQENRNNNEISNTSAAEKELFLPNGNEKSAVPPTVSSAWTRENHSQSSSSSSILSIVETENSSCCSSKSSQVTKQSPMLATVTPLVPPQILPHDVMSFHTSYYQYPVPATIFTYPASYGSFQNPLQAAAWRQTHEAAYLRPQEPTVPDPLPPDISLLPEASDTVHTCGCGDTCQCIGCAAHPFNDATQSYVRSACQSMSSEKSSAEIYGNGHSASGSGTVLAQPLNAESTSSPNQQSPSDSHSVNGDEQILSENDFLFVNYSFDDEGCGGDTHTCPCGDDCQCIGCEIHKGVTET